MLPGIFKTSLKMIVSWQLWLTQYGPQVSWKKEPRLVWLITRHRIILNRICAAKGNVKQFCVDLSADRRLVKQAKAVILASKRAELSTSHPFWMVAHHEFTDRTWEQRDHSSYLAIMLASKAKATTHFLLNEQLVLWHGLSSPLPWARAHPATERRQLTATNQTPVLCRWLYACPLL